MKISIAKKEDFNNIINIEYEVNKRLYAYKSKEQVKKILENYFNKTNFFILENKDDIIGYISLTKSMGYGNILFIAIKEKYQGKGVGSRLIQFAEEYFKRLNCKKIRLEVASKNNKAIQFYNYHKFYIIKKYKEGKSFKLVMSKEI